MKNKKLIAFLIILSIVLFACEGFPTPEVDPTPSEDAVATAVSAIKTADAALADSPTEDPTEIVIDPTSTVETPIICDPIHPGQSTVLYPVGAALSLSATPEQLDLFDFESISLGSIDLPDLSWRNSDQIHLASSLSDTPANMATVYHSLFMGGQSLRLSQNNSSSELYGIPPLVRLTGEDGGPFISYSTSDSSASGGWVSELYAGDLQIAGNNPPILIRDEGDGYVILPLAIQLNNGQAAGVWYTESMWGIGNIIFAPYRGLFYIDLQTNDVTTFLSTDNIIAGFSPDNSWVAYAINPIGNNPGQAQNQLNLKNLITCQELVLPFSPTTNLGSGWLTFSLDNQYIAWIEAFGPSNMEATTRIRIAQIDGTILVDALPDTLGGLVGGENPNQVFPYKWVADHILAVRVSVNGFSDPFLVLWAPDPNFPIAPALGANQSALIGSGIGMSLIFP